MNEYIRTELKQPVVIENIITVHYFEYTKNFAFSGEAHDFWEIVFADKGDLYITAGNSEFLLRQGQMFIHRPMEFHNIRCDGKTASNSVIVTFSCAAAELFAVAGSILRCGDETRIYWQRSFLKQKKLSPVHWEIPIHRVSFVSKTPHSAANS